MVKKVLYFALILFFLGVIHGLATSITDLWGKRNVITEAQKELVVKEQENKKLKNQLARAQSSEFIEEEARNKLFLTKPGQEPVIIPHDMLKQNVATPTPTQEPNWKQWVDVFTK